MGSYVFIFILTLCLISILFTNLALYNYKHSVFMAEKDKGIIGALLAIAGIIGGAYLIGEIAKNNVNKKVKYKCPRCSSGVDYKQDKCHICDAKLKWKF